jgi:hypothetical protein
MNKDEEWYKNLPEYEKVNYLHVNLIGKDKIIRIPVPFELGHIFQSAPVAFLNAKYTENPEEVKEAFSEIIKRSNPMDWPASLGPIVDVLSNEDFAGRPIVSRSMEGKLPEDRVKKHTTALVREIGKIINYSPAKIEHVINSYSGGLYNRTARIGQEINSQSDWPVIGTLFLRDPYAPKAQIDKFYRRRDLLSQKKRSDKITDNENKLRLNYDRASRKLTPLFGLLKTAKEVEDREQIYSEIKEIVDRTFAKENPRN